MSAQGVYFAQVSPPTSYQPSEYSLFRSIINLRKALELVPDRSLLGTRTHTANRLTFSPESRRTGQVSAFGQVPACSQVTRYFKRGIFFCSLLPSPPPNGNDTRRFQPVVWVHEAGMCWSLACFPKDRLALPSVEPLMFS